MHAGYFVHYIQSSIIVIISRQEIHLAPGKEVQVIQPADLLRVRRTRALVDMTGCAETL